MSNNRPQRLGDVLAGVIDEMGLRKKLDEARVVEAWEATAGPQVRDVTERAWVKGGRLYVKIQSAAWRQELQMQRGRWKERLNNELGRALVDEIVFR
jgi:predicted nucleic acid-binding Zn ribbon protein